MCGGGGGGGYVRLGRKKREAGDPRGDRKLERNTKFSLSSFINPL